MASEDELSDAEEALRLIAQKIVDTPESAIRNFGIQYEEIVTQDSYQAEREADASYVTFMQSVQTLMRSYLKGEIDRTAVLERLTELEERTNPMDTQEARNAESEHYRKRVMASMHSRGQSEPDFRAHRVAKLMDPLSLKTEFEQRLRSFRNIAECDDSPSSGRGLER